MHVHVHVYTSLAVIMLYTTYNIVLRISTVDLLWKMGLCWTVYWLWDGQEALCCTRWGVKNKLQDLCNTACRVKCWVSNKIVRTLHELFTINFRVIVDFMIHIELFTWAIMLISLYIELCGLSRADASADWWSLGAILFEILTGKVCICVDPFKCTHVLLL